MGGTTRASRKQIGLTFEDHAPLQRAHVGFRAEDEEKHSLTFIIP
jgi:hypothetical protein